MPVMVLALKAACRHAKGDAHASPVANELMHLSELFMLLSHPVHLMAMHQTRFRVRNMQDAQIEDASRLNAAAACCGQVLGRPRQGFSLQFSQGEILPKWPETLTLVGVIAASGVLGSSSPSSAKVCSCLLACFSPKASKRSAPV